MRRLRPRPEHCERARVVAELDPVDPLARAVRASRPGSANGWVASSSRAADDDRVRRRRRWPARRAARRPPTPSPRRWPTVKSWCPRCSPEPAARAVDDLARADPRARRGGRGTRACPRRRGSRGPGSRPWRRPRGRRRAASSRTSRLGQIAEREAQPRERLRAQARRACRSGPWPGRAARGQQRARRRRRRCARSGRWRALAAPSRSARAIIASIRSSPLQTTQGFGRAARPRSRRGTRRPPPPRNCSLEVERQVRDARADGRAARAPSTASGEQQLRSPSVRRSAQSFRVTATTSRPALALAQRGDGRVDAAAERDQHPLPVRGRDRRAGRPDPVEPRRARDGARRRRARRRGDPAGKPAELGLDIIGPDPRRLQDRGRPRPARQPRRPPRRSRRSPPRSKLTRSIRPSWTRREMRTRSPQGAPPAEPLKAPSGAGPRRLSSAR